MNKRLAKAAVFATLLLQLGWLELADAGRNSRGQRSVIKPRVSKTRSLIGRTGYKHRLRCHSLPAFYWRLTPTLMDVQQRTTAAWLRSPLVQKLSRRAPNAIVEVYDRTLVKTDYHTAIVTEKGTVIEKRSLHKRDRIEEISWREFGQRYAGLPTTFYRPVLTLEDFVAENALQSTTAHLVLRRINGWERRVSSHLLWREGQNTDSVFYNVYEEVDSLMEGELRDEPQELQGTKFADMTPELTVRALNLTRLLTLRDLTNPY